MKAVEKYNRIVKELIRKSFPVLNNVKIRLKIRKLKMGSMRATKVYGGYLIIIDSDKYKDAKDIEIIGAIAHELMHFESDHKKGWIRYFFEYIHYKLSKKFMRNAEIENDKLTIQRGYARELYANRTYRIKKNPIKNIPRVGLPYLLPKEVKSYAKKIGKW